MNFFSSSQRSRFEMRGLLVNNEDLLRVNAQLNNEMKRLREQMIEFDRERQTRDDKLRAMEVRAFGSSAASRVFRRPFKRQACVCRWRWRRPGAWWWRPTARSTPSTSCSSPSKTAFRMQRCVNRPTLPTTDFKFTFLFLRLCDAKLWHQISLITHK